MVSADGSEVDLPAITGALDALGTPYSVYKESDTPGGLTANKLFSGSHAFYNGVVLATNVIPLSVAEWQALWSFEGQFGVRSVSWYSYPYADYGFSGSPTAVDTTTSPIAATYTPAGASTFPYVNSTNPLPIEQAYTYLAPAATDGNTKTLLQDSQANALAVISNYPTQGNRQTLALTFASNQYLVHDRVLAYGLIDWVTGGVHLGERHAYLDPQPDDIFIDDSTWPAATACGTNVEDPNLPTVRMSGTDLAAVVKWQQGKPVTVELPFNGAGTTGGAYSPDTLTPAARSNQAAFKWVSHTWDHANLDTITRAAASSELSKNTNLAKQLGLQRSTPANLVTPDVSGLTNPQFLSAAVANGVRYLVTDTSRAGYGNPKPNEGIYNSYQRSILMIPRHPVNLYFNVTTPQEWLAEDNCLHPAGTFGYVTSYDQLLERESSVMLGYLLTGDIDPLMFHQPNLVAYNGSDFLLGNLINRTLAKYNALLTLPILSPAMNEIGTKMADRMAYDSSGASASIVPGKSITIRTQRAATVPVTGLKGASAESYGGMSISYVRLGANQSVTLPLQ